jgi:MFS family permease
LQTLATDSAGLVTAAGGLVLLVAFFAWERRARSPMIPPSVFANARFTGANVYTFLLYAALGGSLFFVPFDLQNVQGYSPTAAGGVMLPFIIIMFALSRWSGGLAGTIGARLPLIVGATVAGFGFLAFARAGSGGSYWATFFPAAVILGFGGALFVAPLTTTVMDALDPARAGIASGINNAVARVAGLLAVAALGIVLSGVLYARFDGRITALHPSAATQQVLARERAAIGTGKPLDDVREPDRTPVNDLLRASYTAGFQWVMVAAALLSFAAALVATLMIPVGDGIRRS